MLAVVRTQTRSLIFRYNEPLHCKYAHVASLCLCRQSFHCQIDDIGYCGFSPYKMVKGVRMVRCHPLDNRVIIKLESCLFRRRNYGWDERPAFQDSISRVFLLIVIGIQIMFHDQLTSLIVINSIENFLPLR